MYEFSTCHFRGGMCSAYRIWFYVNVFCHLIFQCDKSGYTVYTIVQAKCLSAKGSDGDTGFLSGWHTGPPCFTITEIHLSFYNSAIIFRFASVRKTYRPVIILFGINRTWKNVEVWREAVSFMFVVIIALLVYYLWSGTDIAFELAASRTAGGTQSFTLKPKRNECMVDDHNLRLISYKLVSTNSSIWIFGQFWLIAKKD